MVERDFGFSRLRTWTRLVGLIGAGLVSGVVLGQETAPAAVPGGGFRGDDYGFGDLCGYEWAGSVGAGDSAIDDSFGFERGDVEGAGSVERGDGG